MGNRFAEIAFTPAVQAEQERYGSRKDYQRFLEGEPWNDELSAKEADFIHARDGFYLASCESTR